MRRVPTLCLPLVLLLTLALGSTPVAAAGGDHLWSRGFDPETYADLTADGAVFLAGMFYGTIDLGGGPLVATAPFAPDMYVAKLDANGNHVFSFSIAGGQGHSVKALRTDPDGGAYVMGRIFSGTVDFGGGPLSASTSFYVVRFDANGDHVFSGLYGDAEFSDAEADAQGVVIVGATRSTADFGGGALTTAGGTDALIARLDGAGHHVFSARYGDLYDQYAWAVGTDAAGSPVMAVQIGGTVDFGGGPLVPAGFGLALVELDASGAHVRSTLIDGDFTSGITYNLHLDVDDGGAHVVAGELHGAADFGGGPLYTAGNTDVFVALFDTDGVHQFSQSYGSSSYQVVNSVTFGVDGSILLSGNFVNDLDFGGGPLSAAATTSELFLARLNPSGAHEYSTAFAASQGAFALVTRTGANGAVLLVANATPELDLGGGPLGDHYNFLGVLEGDAAPTASPSTSPVVLERVGNHPNPFNPRTTITFELARRAPVELTVVDARGRKVSARELGELDAGRHSLTWDGNDTAGHGLASGVFTLVVRSGRETAAHRMVLVR